MAGSTKSRASTRSSTPPWPGQEPAHVLQAEVPLDQRLAQVAERGHHATTTPSRAALAGVHGWMSPDHDGRDEDGGHGAADESLPGLVGADARGQGAAAHAAADDQRADVVGHGGDDGAEEEGDAVAVGEQVDGDSSRPA